MGSVDLRYVVEVGDSADSKSDLILFDSIQINFDSILIPFDSLVIQPFRNLKLIFRTVLSYYLTIAGISTQNQPKAHGKLAVQ